MKFYINEDISPKVAEILRKHGIDGVSAHVISHRISDSDFGEMAALLEKCAKKNPEGMGAYTIEFIKRIM